ncbi:hypothetical protein HK099_004143, partial [Clydaea vesicula]
MSVRRNSEVQLRVEFSEILTQRRKSDNQHTFCQKIDIGRKEEEDGHEEEVLLLPQSKLSHQSFNKKATKKSTPSQLQKFLALFFLVIQTSSISLLLRYSFVSTSTPYLKSSSIFFSELFKFCIASLVLVFRNDFDYLKLSKIFFNDVMDQKQNYIMVIPALIYALQNNLLFIAISNLEPATFQILSQSKILTTAVFSYFMLQKRFANQKIFALILLMVSVILVQFGIGKKSARMDDNPMLGYMSVLLAATSSGFASCYFEKQVKSPNSCMW